jgi:hypothetical protein
MERMLPCTALYLQIRVTFSTPTGVLTNKQLQLPVRCFTLSFAPLADWHKKLALKQRDFESMPGKH